MKSPIKIMALLIMGSTQAGFAQHLPATDHGISLSGNYSNRHMPSSSTRSAFIYPSADYHLHVNFKRHLSLKTGAGLFMTGHVATYNIAPDRGPYAPQPAGVKVIYGYIRIPLLLSVNIGHAYADLGGAPCLRIYNNSNSYYKRGNGISKPGATYTLEGHLGYYIPLKQQRLFIEGAAYVSEIDQLIYLPDGNHANTYSTNFRLSVGYMFSKL